MVCCLLFGGCERAARLIESGYRMTIARGMDGRAPVRPPLRPLSTGIRHRFSSAVCGDQSGGFARFATRLNLLTPCFVTGKNFPRMRPGAVLSCLSARDLTTPPLCKQSSGSVQRPIAHQGQLLPSNPTIGPSNQSSLQCQLQTRHARRVAWSGSL